MTLPPWTLPEKLAELGSAMKVSVISLCLVERRVEKIVGKQLEAFRGKAVDHRQKRYRQKPDYQLDTPHIALSSSRGLARLAYIWPSERRY